MLEAFAIVLSFGLSRSVAGAVVSKPSKPDLGT